MYVQSLIKKKKGREIIMNKRKFEDIDKNCFILFTCPCTTEVSFLRGFSFFHKLYCFATFDYLKLMRIGIA